MDNLEFKYVPLSFISTNNEIIRQTFNTTIFDYVRKKYQSYSKLGDLLDSTQYGFTDSAKQFGSHKFLRITDINNGDINWKNVPYCDCVREDKYLLKENDVLIARTGNNISVLINETVPNNAVFASYLIRLRPNLSKILPGYLILFLNSYAFWPQILKKQKGAVLQNVNAGLMRDLVVPICPIEKQKEIIKLNKNNELFKLFKSEAIEKLNLYFSLSKEIQTQKQLISQLKQAILQEAIQGKLTQEWREQNPDAEPASELLKRIKTEKAQLIKDKKIRKEKPLPPIEEDEIPFEIPESWVWCRLGDIVNFQIGKTPASKNMEYWSNGTIDWLNIRDMIDFGYITKTSKKITEKALKDVFKTQNIVEPNTLLMSFKLTVGKVSINKIPLFHNEAIISIYPFTDVQQKLLFNLLPSITELSASKKVLMGQTFNSTSLSNMVFPLAPKQEQKAIVKKVETLMLKCNDLEQEITQSEEHANMLMQAVLKEAFAGEKIK